MPDSLLNVALPKGRLGDKVHALFSEIGYGCALYGDPGRKLVIKDEAAGLSYFLVKPTDVPIYIEQGVADIGVVGKDILLETNPDVYELLDLGLGKCRVALCGPKDFSLRRNAAVRVATKYVNITKNYLASKYLDSEVIKLSGSIELAPILGLSDVIVDIVETGSTLRENNLEVLEEILPVSARLIANKAGYKFKYDMIAELTEKLKGVIT